MKKIIMSLSVSVMLLATFQVNQLHAGVGGAIVKGVAVAVPRMIATAVKGFFIASVKKAPKMIMNMAKKRAKTKITSLIKTKKDKEFALKEIQKYSKQKEYSSVGVDDLITAIQVMQVQEIINE